MRIIDTVRDKMADALAVNPLTRTHEQGQERYNGGSFDLYDSDVAYSAVQWVANQASRVIIEAPETSLRLLEAPIQMESARLLINSLVTDCSIMGTTYVHIETDETGRATGLRWVPDSCMSRRPSRNFAFYTYYLDGRRVDVQPDRMMVIRQNVSPSRYREGLGLKHVLQDTVFVDWYTERYLADILPTMPAPYVGLDVSQYKSAQGEKAFENLSNRIATKLRPRRSSSNPVTVVENADTKIISPVLGDFVDTGVNLRAEERVCAFLEINPVVPGFSSGNKQSRVGAATHELVRLSWQTGVIPKVETVQNALNHYLKPLTNEEIVLRYDHIEYLRPTVKEAQLMTDGPWLTREEMRRLFQQYIIEEEDGD